ncbi:MAG TPA: c-type cytochrome [Candidatus Dormibacteraeota bacterium]|nr:c-type cytochrome [Candidatus Dormibacteraeota bacterium]
MSLKRWKKLLLVLVALGVLVAVYGAVLIRRGFSVMDEPAALEKLVARTVRNLAIPAAARHENNPLKASPEILNEARDSFIDRCAVCHGNDGSVQTQVGRSLYPKPPDLRLPQTQNLTDGQIRYIIKNGVRLTGMPAWSHPHEEQDNDSWKLVLFTDVKVRAHTFTFISPAMTDKYKIPNPCTSCHTDKSTAWTTEALRHWPERSPWRLD